MHYNGLACTHGGASSVALRSDGGFLLFPTSPRNRLGEEFISALAQDFAKHGAAVIERVRQEKPAGYLKVVASLLPKDVNLNVRPLDDLSDEQLLMRLRVLTKQAAPLLARVAEDVGALQH